MEIWIQGLPTEGAGGRRVVLLVAGLTQQTVMVPLSAGPGATLYTHSAVLVTHSGRKPLTTLTGRQAIMLDAF